MYLKCICFNKFQLNLSEKHYNSFVAACDHLLCKTKAKESARSAQIAVSHLQVHEPVILVNSQRELYFLDYLRRLYVLVPYYCGVHTFSCDCCACMKRLS